MKKSNNGMKFMEAVKCVLDYTKEYKKWYILSYISDGKLKK